MSKLEELIHELCPDGVEYKKIGDIAIESKEKNKNREFSEVRTVTNESKLVRTSDYFDRNITSEDTSGYMVVRTNMFVYNPSRINIGSIAYSTETSPVILSPMYVVFSVPQNILLNKFLLLYLKSGIGMHKIQSKVEPGARFRLPFNSLAKITIPVPPIEVQQEIVRILGSFTELTTELTAELTARKQQYAYYRDKLLTFEDDKVEFKPVRELYKRLKGTPITAGKMKEIENPNGEIRIFAGGKTAINANESDISNANIIRQPAVLIQSRGIIDVIYYDKPFTFKSEMWAYTADDIISVKFLYYVLKNNIQKFRDAALGMGSMPQISLPVTENFMIPVPADEIRDSVVRFLEQFDTLCNDFFSGLPAEIEARQKQYVYYRDELLKFKELD